MDQTITNILKLASENPDYQSIANYLMSRRAFPEIGYMAGPSKSYGTFTAPSLFGNPNIPERGRISLPINTNTTNPQDVVPTVLHELTHATQTQLYKQYNEIKNKKEKTDLDKQFMENFDKIMGAKPTEQIAKFSPEFAKNKVDYRSRGDEALSFALENANYPNQVSGWNVPANVDPTLATQIMLLLEQAQRTQNQQPPSQGR
jgi:hypothetical protein